MIYLACPYSHPDSNVREYRFKMANRAAAKLMRDGHIVYSPISHTHPIAMEGDLPLDWAYEDLRRKPTIFSRGMNAVRSPQSLLKAERKTIYPMPHNMGVCLLMTISQDSSMVKDVSDFKCIMTNGAKDILISKPKLR